MQVFRSAVDGWYYGVLVLTTAILGGAFYPLLSIGGVAVWGVMLGSGLLALGIPLWLLFSTRYTISRELLVVQSGPLSWKIPRAGIQNIRPSRSLLSSPALSLDRLEISYGAGKVILVSPADKAGFIAALGFQP